MIHTLLHYPLPIPQVVDRIVDILDDRPVSGELQAFVTEGVPFGGNDHDFDWTVRHLVLVSNLFNDMPTSVRETIVRAVFSKLATRHAVSEHAHRVAVRSLSFATAYTSDEAAWLGLLPPPDPLSTQVPEAHHFQGVKMPEKPRRPLRLPLAPPPLV